MSRTLTYEIFTDYVADLIDYESDDSTADRIGWALEFFTQLFPDDVPYIRSLAAKALNVYRNELNDCRRRARERRESGEVSVDFSRLTAITEKHLLPEMEKALWGGSILGKFIKH